jgi:hypothetical protein
MQSVAGFRDAGIEANIFQVSLDKQAAELKAWKGVWGIGTPTDRTKASAHFQLHLPSVARYLYLIHYLLRNLKNVDQRFGVVMAQCADNKLTLVSDFEVTTEWVKKRRKHSGRPTNRLVCSAGFTGGSRGPRPPWSGSLVIQLVEELVTFFRSPLTSDVAVLVQGTILPSNEWEFFRTMQSEVASSDEQSLSALAWYREQIHVMNERGGTTQSSNVQPTRILGDNLRSDPANNRAFGQYEGRDVLIEWKVIHSAKKDSSSKELTKRVKNIADLLRLDKMQRQFRTLDCLALVRDTQPDHIWSGFQDGVVNLFHAKGHSASQSRGDRTWRPVQGGFDVGKGSNLSPVSLLAPQGHPKRQCGLLRNITGEN